MQGSAPAPASCSIPRNVASSSGVVRPDDISISRGGSAGLTTPRSSPARHTGAKAGRKVAHRASAAQSGMLRPSIPPAPDGGAAMLPRTAHEAANTARLFWATNRGWKSGGRGGWPCSWGRLHLRTAVGPRTRTRFNRYEYGHPPTDTHASAAHTDELMPTTTVRHQATPSGTTPPRCYPLFTDGAQQGRQGDAPLSCAPHARSSSLLPFWQ